MKKIITTGTLLAEEKKKLARLLCELRQDFTNALVEREKNGGAHYNDQDFDSLEQFMVFLKNNY